MIGLLQRVACARVEVDGVSVGAIDAGLLVFVCAEPSDTPAVADRFVEKILRLRVFADAAGKMNRSVAEVGGGLLLISQFTLAADLSGGNRPSFTRAAPPEQGRSLYERVVATACRLHAPVAGGRFGAHMRVHSINDGPVTLPMTLRA